MHTQPTCIEKLALQEYTNRAVTTEEGTCAVVWLVGWKEGGTFHSSTIDPLGSVPHTKKHKHESNKPGMERVNTDREVPLISHFI